MTNCEKNMIEAAQAGVFVEGSATPEEIIQKMGVYGPHFTYTVGFQQLGVHKNGLYQTSNSPALGGYKERSPELHTYFGNFSFNNDNLADLLSSPRSVQENYTKEHLGKTVTYKMVENGAEIYKHDLYVPKEIIIDLEGSKLGLTSGTAGAIKLGSPLYINQDINNKNGLLLILWYKGERADMTMDDIQNGVDETNEFKRYLHIPEDSGIIELPAEFMDGVPDRGMFYLQISRLNFHIMELNGNTHKLQGGNSYGINLILNR